MDTETRSLIRQAFWNAWIDMVPEEVEENEYTMFSQKWGDISIISFKRALASGEGMDRLWAIFALGYLAPPGVENLLFPFLHSSVRKERWASAMMLGRLRDERVFPSLLDLLGEMMEYQIPFPEIQAMTIWFEARQEAQQRFGDPDAWKRLVSLELVRAIEAQHAYASTYNWHTIHRITIAKLLGNWGEKSAIPLLRQTLKYCWELEGLPHARSGASLGTLHQLEDALAYALGQLQAWDALEGLDLPPPRFKLARCFLIFGALHINLQQLGQGNISMLISIGHLHPEQVVALLQTHYGLDEILARANLTMFQSWYRERDPLHQMSISEKP